MQIQNYQNHSTLKSLSRISILFYTTVIGFNIIAMANLCAAVIAVSGRSVAFLFLLVSLIFIISYFLFRSFSLKAQDRAIRAEENLRYFALTGKLLDSNLKIHQVIALRFAGDEEFVALTERAVKENLSNKEIKMAVKNWRADYHRA